MISREREGGGANCVTKQVVKHGFCIFNQRAIVNDQIFVLFFGGGRGISHETIPKPHVHTDAIQHYYAITTQDLVIVIITIFFAPKPDLETRPSRRLPLALARAKRKSHMLHCQAGFHKSRLGTQWHRAWLPAPAPPSASSTPTTPTGVIFLSGAGGGIVGPSAMYLSL